MIGFWLKVFDTSILDGTFFTNRLVELAIRIAIPIKWSTRNQLFDIQQEEIHMLLVKMCTSKTMLKMVGSSVRQFFR